MSKYGSEENDKYAEKTIDDAAWVLQQYFSGQMFLSPEQVIVLAGKVVRRCLNAEARINSAKTALVNTGHFKPNEVGDDIAPRIIELWGAKRPSPDPVCGPNSVCRDALHTEGEHHTPKCGCIR